MEQKPFARQHAVKHCYVLITQWRLEASIKSVWDALYAAEVWPCWWKYVLAVELLAEGDATGLGTVRRYTWSSRLPYELCFNMRVTKVEPPYKLAAEASGELNGTGLWTLSTEKTVTRVRYDWEVATSRAWMNVLAPLLALAFRWNHGQVMAAGARGLAQHLGVRLLP